MPVLEGIISNYIKSLILGNYQIVLYQVKAHLGFSISSKVNMGSIGHFYIVHVCGLLLTVPLLTTIMFQNASSWRLVFSTKSLAEQKLKSLVTSLNDLTQQTTQQDTLLALRCFCWKNSGKNVSRRSYY